MVMVLLKNQNKIREIVRKWRIQMYVFCETREDKNLFTSYFLDRFE